MVNGFFKLILPFAFCYGSSVYAADAAVGIGECFGRAITLDQVGQASDFFSSFEAAVVASRMGTVPNKNSCEVVSVLSNISGDSPVLVDVRNFSRGREFKVSDIINIPLHELKTKDFLKGRSLVLFDEAFRYYELLEECRFLKTLGFGKISVFAEAAGLSSGPLSMSWHYVDPADFHILKQKWQWLVFDLMGTERNSTSGNLINLNPKADKPILTARVERGFEDFRIMHGFYPHALFLDRQGRDYSLVRDVIPEKYRDNVFFLNGGIENYQNFILQHVKILVQKKQIDDREAIPCGALN